MTTPKIVKPKCAYCGTTLREPVDPPVCIFCLIEKCGAKPV